jgi:hypothetical protein
VVSASSGLSTPAIAGVSVAAAVVVVVVAFLLFHRRRGRAVDHEKEHVEYEVAGDESIFTEDSAQFKLGLLPQSLQGSIRGSISGSSVKSSSGSDYTPKNLMLGTGKSRSVAQFDPSNAAAAIALGLGGGVIVATGSSRGNSVRSMDSDTKEAKILDLDEAINCGDWEKVARLAGSLASSEEISTMSEVSSNAGPATSVRSSLSSLRSEEARMAAQIDELVRRGDWSGVAAAAEIFSSSSDRNGANQGVADASGEQLRRSFLDFVTGRRILSSAADAAIVPISQDLIDNDASQHSVVGLGKLCAYLHVIQRSTIATFSPLLPFLRHSEQPHLVFFCWVPDNRIRLKLCHHRRTAARKTNAAIGSVMLSLRPLLSS